MLFDRICHNNGIKHILTAPYSPTTTGKIERARPTKGGEVLRVVDSSGALSFAGAAYRMGNKYIGQIAGVRLVADTVQITIDETLVRTHKARHDKSKEFGALAQPNGKPRRNKSVA